MMLCLAPYQKSIDSRAGYKREGDFMKGVDLLISFDTTGSMSGVIDKAIV
jgi:hypothetical protein